MKTKTLFGGEDTPIPATSDPSWDAIDVLEGYVHESTFYKRWRAFLRACSALLLPTLPPEAQDWLAAADGYEIGHLDLDALTDVRVRAWHFHDGRRDTSSATERSGLRAAMWRLWPDADTAQWNDSAWHFLHFCEQAGIQRGQWLPLLREQFADELG